MGRAVINALSLDVFMSQGEEGWKSVLKKRLAQKNFLNEMLASGDEEENKKINDGEMETTVKKQRTRSRKRKKKSNDTEAENKKTKKASIPVDSIMNALDSSTRC
mmetsp:Transcript_11166/g.17078  ORF Transcript_11166/g.17078 Transcript_11166/m.17078 type:complete len:105 (-) Transcript_11166:196-510(-)